MSIVLSNLWNSVGKRTDTATTTVSTTGSIIAYVKGLANRIPPDTSAGIIAQYGAAGTPSVTAATNAASANTFGSWAQVIASTAADLWLCSVSVASVDAQIVAGVTFVIEVGTGAGGAESTNIRFSSSFAEAAFLHPIIFTLPIPIKVAAGTRVAVRAANSTSDLVTYNVGLSYYTGLE